MYQTLQITIVSTLLIVRHECRPAERAQTAGISPADVIVDIKEGLAYNLIQKRIIDSVHVSINIDQTF